MVVPAAVVGRVSINDIIRHFRLQIPDLTSEFVLVVGCVPLALKP